MQIEYKKIDENILKDIFVKYGEMAKNHIYLNDDSISIAVLRDNVPVGFICAYIEQFTPPLYEDKDVCISIIEVDEQYRRQGIGSKLVDFAEKWAAKNGFSQIRAWSSEDKIEAIPMWRKLGYCMCPAKIWVEWCKEIVDGYHVAKKLSPIADNQFLHGQNIFRNSRKSKSDWTKQAGK